jgi:hypothetical protein
LATSDPRDPFVLEAEDILQLPTKVRPLVKRVFAARGDARPPELHLAAAGYNSDLAHYSNAPHGQLEDEDDDENEAPFQAADTRGNPRQTRKKRSP